MDISTLKDKLGDETFAKLESYVQGLNGKIEAAQADDATKRLKFKEVADHRDRLRKRLEALSDHIGIDDETDIAELPKPGKITEESKQLEVKLKRAERERDEAKKLADDASGKYRSSLQRAAVAEAMGGHDFVARDIVETYVGQRLAWEGDELLFKTDDGKLVPVKDGVAVIAKTRPELLKAAGAGGAGVRQSNAAGSGGGAKTISRTQYEALSPEAKAAIDWKSTALSD